MGQQWNAEEHDGLTPRERASLPESLTRALGFLNQRLEEPIALDDLAGVAGVRPRTTRKYRMRWRKPSRSSPRTTRNARSVAR